MVEADEWTAYEQRFVEPDGRVLDDANGGISHSEGQGYGLLLAYLADDRPAFERIWTFTSTQLLLRDDGLAAWKWEAEATPHITDTNNATDGDLLIAYALARAGQGWEVPAYVDSARQIALAIVQDGLTTHGGRLLIKPGVEGFDADDREDGPVVNPSYWVFEAFPVLAALAPDADWDRLREDGLALLRQAAFGERELPPEWLSLERAPRPAQGFAPEFGYNAMRVPLYMIRAGIDDAPLLRRLLAGMSGPNGGIAIVDLQSGAIREEPTDPGYRMLLSAIACVLDDTSVPQAQQRFEPTTYYPSTLHLLALAHLREARPQCL